MRATRLVSYAARSLQVEEFELPVRPGAGEVFVETECTLVSSGTEIANYLGITTQRVALGADWRERPYYPGYSLVGQVLAVGKGVDAVEVGDRVACGAPHASHAAVGVERLVRVPEALSSEQAAWSTLIAIVLNAVRMAPIQLGDSVAVVGLGPIGQLAAQLTRLAGGRPVVGFDRIERRRQIAVECGAGAALDLEPGKADPASRVVAASEDCFDFVFEATGSPSAFSPALGLVAPGGLVVLLGSTRGLVEAFDPYRDVHLKGVTIVGAHANTAPTVSTRRDRWTERENRRLGLSLVAEGSLRVSPLVSHRHAVADAPEVFAQLAADRSPYLGVLISWR